MPRRRRRSRSAGPNSRPRARPSAPRAATPRARPTRPRAATPARARQSRSAWQRADTLSSGKRASSLLANQRRRDALHKQRNRAAASRLSAGLVPARTHNEDASSRKTAGLCRRSKEERRAVIIATGKGGINGARVYRARRKCGTNS